MKKNKKGYLFMKQRVE